MVKESFTAPLPFRNLASSRFPLTSNIMEPITLSDTYIAGWFSDPPPVCPELPFTA